MPSLTHRTRTPLSILGNSYVGSLHDGWIMIPVPAYFLPTGRAVTPPSSPRKQKKIRLLPLKFLLLSENQRSSLSILPAQLYCFLWLGDNGRQHFRDACQYPRTNNGSRSLQRIPDL